MRFFIETENTARIALHLCWLINRFCPILEGATYKHLLIYLRGQTYGDVFTQFGDDVNTTDIWSKTRILDLTCQHRTLHSRLRTALFTSKPNPLTHFKNTSKCFTLEIIPGPDARNRLLATHWLNFLLLCCRIFFLHAAHLV